MDAIDHLRFGSSNVISDLRWSRLRFHGIGTQAPHEVWIAVAQGATRPRLDYPPVRVTLVSGSAFTYGVERHQVDGVPVRIYSPAKTVTDCFELGALITDLEAHPSVKAVVLQSANPDFFIAHLDVSKAAERPEVLGQGQSLRTPQPPRPGMSSH